VCGKYFGATSTSPVDSSPFSLNVPCRPVTAVRAVVCARPGIPAHGMIPRDAAAQLTKLRKAAVGEGRTADGVDDHSHFHAGAGALLERVENLVGNAAFLEDVTLDVHGLPGASDGGELGGIELIAIREHLEGVAGGRPAAGRRGEEAQGFLGVERLAA